MIFMLDLYDSIFALPKLGIGMDSSITPLRHGGLSLVQTTDFFYPLVEDPYMQGKELPFKIGIYIKQNII